MTVELSPELEALIQKRLQTGAFSTAEEVIERALELLNAEEDWLASNRDEIASQIQDGWEEARRGELTDGENVRTEILSCAGLVALAGRVETSSRHCRGERVWAARTTVGGTGADGKTVCATSPRDACQRCPPFKSSWRPETPGRSHGGRAKPWPHLLGKVEAVQVHYFAPGRHEVTNERLL